jgi:hypothetical protein
MINDEDKAKIIFNRILNIQHRLSSVESEILDAKNTIIQGNLISVKEKFIERINFLNTLLDAFEGVDLLKIKLQKKFINNDPTLDIELSRSFFDGSYNGPEIDMSEIDKTPPEPVKPPVIE